MRKRLAAAALCVIFTLTACATRTAVDPPESSESSSETSVPVSSAGYSHDIEPYQPPEVDPLRRAYAVYCVEDDELLEGSNTDVHIAPASLTKIMTCAVALRNIDIDEVFTVGSEQELVMPDSSLAYIYPGQRLTLRMLIMGMLLPSGNDAAYCVAVNTARRVSSSQLDDKQAVIYFARMMNRFAAELGMYDTHFANPDGWDNDRHYTTVSDLIKLTKYALTVPEIYETAAMTEAHVTYESGETNVWYNSNLLLDPDSDYYCEYATGLKTGVTDNAGRCFIGTFVKNGKTYIIITMGYETIKERYRHTLRLFSAIK